MLRHQLWIPAVAFAALLVLGSACGDDGSSSSSATAASSPSAASSGPSTSASGAKGTAPNASTAVTSGLADLQKAAQDLKVIDYEVVYDSSITDAKGASTTGSMTLAHKGVKSLISIDGSFTGSGAAGKTTIIDDGTSTFVCTDQGTKVCQQSKSSGATAANPFLGLATAFSADNLVSAFSKNGYDVKSVSGQSIAGRSAKCYEATGPTGSGTICLDSKNGMMLLIDGADTTKGQTKKTVFKATRATDSPSDDVFTPPYPVKAQP